MWFVAKLHIRLVCIGYIIAGTAVGTNDDSSSLDSAAASYIAGGEESAVYAWPYVARMIEIKYREKTCMVNGCGACGGVIVNTNWILTAGHCCTIKQRSNLKSTSKLSFQVGGHFDRTCEYSGLRLYSPK